MTSPVNQHCASWIGTLSFPIRISGAVPCPDCNHNRLLPTFNHGLQSNDSPYFMEICWYLFELFYYR